MADFSVNSVNFQLSNTINVPNTSTQCAASVNYSRQTHCYQMPVSTPAVYDSLETTHDEQCVHALWLRRAARVHWRVTKASWVTGMTGKCFDYKELQSLLGVWHHASVNVPLTVKLMTSISWRPRHASSPTIDDVIVITSPPTQRPLTRRTVSGS